MTHSSGILGTIKGLLDVHFLISTFGYPGLFAIVFAETGLFLGFFFPGDSLLITAGILAAKGQLSIWALLPLLFMAAALGNLAGYFFGQKFGKRLFNKKDSKLFHKEHLLAAQAFYEKHGGKAIILARFIPVIRTFAPIVAGIIDMDFSSFLTYNIVGSILWTGGITLGGFFLGKIIPDKYFELIVLVVIVVSLLPGVYELVKTHENRQKLLGMLKRKKK